MPSEMIERVALAISGSDDAANILGIHRDRARLAIEAMREPTSGMIAAGDEIIPDNATYEDNAANAYRYMIDEALK
jgi:hypothetical protein